MDYEKAYKEALEWMRDIYPTLTGATKEDAEHYFPELADSEDERIRKWIVGLIHDGEYRKDEHPMALKAIDWLEKQKEKKPILFKNENLSELIKAEFEGFRNLLKKNGLDYEPQRMYWDDFARLFDSSAREYLKEQKPAFRVTSSLLDGGAYFEEIDESKPAEWSEEDEEVYNKALDAIYYQDCNDKDDVLFALKDLCDLISKKRKVIPAYAHWRPDVEDYKALNRAIEMADELGESRTCEILKGISIELKSL